MHASAAIAVALIGVLGFWAVAALSATQIGAQPSAAPDFVQHPAPPQVSLASAYATSAQQTIPAQDWPQLGRDAQRSNYSPLQVNLPYCYIWKWYEVPFASRAQPVVAGGRLFIGGLDGVLYARNASTGASLWTFAGDGSAIRHSAGVLSDTVICRSQPLYALWQLLGEGDSVMNQAGAVNANWDADWNAIQPYIQNYLAGNPHKQTLFVLDAATGITRGVAPVLYTFGDSDVPAMPVVRAGAPYTAYVMRPTTSPSTGARSASCPPRSTAAPWRTGRC